MINTLSYFRKYVRRALNSVYQMISPFFGLMLLVINILRRPFGGMGIRYFLKKAQIKNGLEKAFLENQNLTFLFKNYFFYKENKDKKRISDKMIRVYGKEEDNWHMQKDYDTFKKDPYGQQRGLILVPLENYLVEKNIKNIFEIGTGNGEVLNFLGKKYPDKNFWGSDLSVNNASSQNSLPNVQFIKAYPLDYFASDKIKNIDLLFCSSTMAVINPQELANLISLIRQRNIKHIIISEPCWSGVKPEYNNNYFSILLESGTWFHNYYALFIREGYKMKKYDFFHYKHNFSPRKDIYINLVSVSL